MARMRVRVMARVRGSVRPRIVDEAGGCQMRVRRRFISGVVCPGQSMKHNALKFDYC